MGALSELIEDGRTGLLVPAGDPHALADALERFIREPALRTRCVEAARQRVQVEWNADRMVERTLAVYEECLTQPRVVVWKLSALGDVLLATPSFRAIRRSFPRGRITLVVGRAAYEVIAHCPYLDDIIIYDPKRKDRGARRHASFLARLRAEAFDLSIDLQNSRKTHLMAWLAGVPVRIGYRRKFGWLLNKPVRLPRVVLAPIAHQHYLLRQAGLMTNGEALELWPSALDEQKAHRLMASGRPATTGTALSPQPVIGIHPGGSARWKTKRWDLERWASLCDALAHRRIQVVVVGGPAERVLGERLAALTKSPPLNLIGQTSLMELACLLKRCDVFVAHDSSSLHVATAVGTPTVALFGPTDPRRHLPPTFAGQVIKKDVFCSPCYSTHCRTITHACMKRIGVEEVLSATLGLLAEADVRT
jgi:heptosyltransferase-2